MDAADCRLVAGVAEWFIGEVLLDVRSKPVDQRSSSFRPVIWRSVSGHVVVVSAPHQSPRCGVSRFRSAQSITIPLSVWSATISPAH